MSNRSLYVGIFICATIIIGLFLATITDKSPKSDIIQINQENPLLSEKLSQSEYSGNGAQIQVNEHALNFSSYTNLAPGNFIYGGVPMGWQGYSTRVDISNLQEAGQWLGNVNCESGGGSWGASEQPTGDPSDISEQYQTGDSYPGAGSHCLEIRFNGWNNSTNILNPELTGSIGSHNPTNWNYSTGTAAYGTEDRAPDIYECRSGGDGDQYYMWHDVMGNLFSTEDEEFSVMIYQTVFLPADGDWFVTNARLSYDWRMFDNGGTSDDWAQAHIRIGGVEVDGHPYLFFADTGIHTRTRSEIDVTAYFQTGTSWVIDFGFVGYINALFPQILENFDAYWNDLNLTIYYQQRIDPLTEGWWTQSTAYSYSGRDLTSATLNLGFRATSTIAEGGFSYIWTQVGSGGQWGTKHYVTYLGAYQILSQIQTNWVLADPINVLPDLSNFVNKSNIQIRLGVTIGGLPFGLSNIVDVRFDYVRLTTTAYLDPDNPNINLRVQDNTHALIHSINQTGQGSGSKSILNSWAGGINHQFSFFINAQTYTTTFNAFLQMNETRISIATSNFTVRDPYIFDEVEWMVNFDPTNLEFLTCYEFQLEIFNDWVPDRIWLPGSIINYELKAQPDIMDIVIPAPPQNISLIFYNNFIQNKDGLWKLRFYAPNYAYQIKSQILTGIWQDTARVYPTNTTRLNVLLKNDTMYWNQGWSSRTIYRVLDADQNPIEQIIADSQSTVNSTETNLLWVVPTDEIGSYISVFGWNDSIASPSKIGFNYSHFEIWRKSSFEYSIINPFDFDNTYLQPQILTFKGQWKDSLSGSPITGGTFQIEYNNSENILTNYTNYVEGKGTNIGNYSIGLPTGNVRMGSQAVNLYLFKPFYDSQKVVYEIPQTIDVSTTLVTPQAKWNATTYYAEALEIYNYNITCKFYDQYHQSWIENGSDPWTWVQVTAECVGKPTGYFKIDPQDKTLWYFTVDTTSISGYQTYNVTMQVLQSSPYQYPFEVQSFLVRIQIIKSQTDLATIQTVIQQPPLGTGNGWTEYNNESDEYTANIYWNQTFLLRVKYINITSGILPINGATVQMKGWPNSGTLYNLSNPGNGYYELQLTANISYPANLYELYINASKAGCYSKIIHVKLNVIAIAADVNLQGQSLINFRENLTVLVEYFNQNDPLIKYADATLRLSSKLNSDYWAENIDYRIIKNLNGTYTLVMFSGESKKINLTGQNDVYIHVEQANIEKITKSYVFFIDPLQSIIRVNTTFFEIPKFESITFPLIYQTTLDAVAIDNATIWIYGIPNYSVQGRSQGLYEITLEASNKTKSYPISILASKQNYAIANLDILLLVRGLDEFVEINVSQTSKILNKGEIAQFTFQFNYIYAPGYLTTDNITVCYNWTHGSGILAMSDSNTFLLELATSGIPAGEYEIIVSAYDRENNKFAEQMVILIVESVPLPPWVYIIIGASTILIIILLALVFYFKYRKPRQIFKNKVLMEKYNRYVDAQNIQHLILIAKNSGLTIGAINYKAEKEVDVDLISGFIQAIGSFGKELSGMDTAMENISYKGFRILLESGQYINTCLLLKDQETESLKNKLKLATQGFEQQFEGELKSFAGNVSAFSTGFSIFDQTFEIYLTTPFKLNYDGIPKAARTFNANQKILMQIITPHVTKDFTLRELFALIKQFKVKLQAPEIFAALLDLIEKKALIPANL